MNQNISKHCFYAKRYRQHFQLERCIFQHWLFHDVQLTGCSNCTFSSPVKRVDFSWYRFLAGLFADLSYIYFSGSLYSLLFSCHFFSELAEASLDLSSASCKSSSNLAGYSCENTIHPNMPRDWAGLYMGGRSTWMEVSLSESRVYDISRMSILNREYGDYGKEEIVSINAQDDHEPYF